MRAPNGANRLHDTIADVLKQTRWQKEFVAPLLTPIFRVGSNLQSKL